ncbi:MAG: hypothetical protein K6G49_01180 [Candidatus Saccharibacteria bacterium]|nr:hypothetical protein [Candidatus Saccharibacteria bacterium]
MNEGQNSGAGNVTPGANIGGSPQPIQPMQQPVGSQPVTPQPMQQPIVSSGTGDIVIGDTGPDKKSRKGVVILIILVVILALVGGGIALWQSGVLGGGGNGISQEQLADLENKYNSYTNYVVYGDETINRPEMEFIEEAAPYFEVSNGESPEVYLERTEFLYAEFRDDYLKSGIKDKIDLTPLETYFLDYVKVRPIDNEEILKIYLKNKQQGAKKVIDERVVSANESLSQYISAVKKYYSSYLDLLAKIDAAGCIRGGEVVTNCYVVGENDEQQLDAALTEVADEVNGLKNSALDTLKSLYISFYGEIPTENQGDGGEQ